MQPHDELTLKAAALARGSPHQWQEFLKAFAAYTETHRANLLKSPLVDLPVLQGRAQSMATLEDLLAKCTSNADKIAGKATK